MMDLTKIGMIGSAVMCRAVEQQEQVQKGGHVSWLPCLLQELLF